MKIGVKICNLKFTKNQNDAQIKMTMNNKQQNKNDKNNNQFIDSNAYQLRMRQIR